MKTIAIVWQMIPENHNTYKVVVSDELYLKLLAAHNKIINVHEMDESLAYINYAVVDSEEYPVGSDGIEDMESYGIEPVECYGSFHKGLIKDGNIGAVDDVIVTGFYF